MQELSRIDFSFKKLFIPLTTAKVIVILFSVGFLVFFNSLFNDFVYDDYGQVVNNPTIRSLANIPEIFLNRHRELESSIYYKPLLTTFFTVIYFFSGENTFLYHLIQLLFHIANSVLIFLIFKKYIKISISLLLALLFLVHPINQETVAYISNLQDVLYMFFGLLSFYILQKNSYKSSNIIISSIFILLSLFSKETGILFLVTNIVYIYLLKRENFKLFLYIIFLICSPYFLLRSIISPGIPHGSLVPIMSLDFWERMINVPAIIFYYIKTLFFPWNLISTNTWIIHKKDFINFYLPLSLISAIFLVLSSMSFYLYKKRKSLGIFFLFWFIIGIAAHIQIIPLDATAADRWFYFPFIGLLGLLGIFFQTIHFNKKTLNIIILIIIIVVMSLLMFRTIIRNADWQNQSTLLAHDIKLSKDDYQLEILYANNLLANKKYSEAYPHIQKALSLFPDDYAAWFSLGVYYHNTGADIQAIKAYEKSLSIKENILTYQNLGLLLLHTDKSTKALNFLRKATEKYPNAAKLWYYRLLIEYTLGNYDDALLAAKIYYQLNKDDKSFEMYNTILNKKPLNIHW